MRYREQIDEAVTKVVNGNTYVHPLDLLQIELLLDIRELLMGQIGRTEKPQRENPRQVPRI